MHTDRADDARAAGGATGVTTGRSAYFDLLRTVALLRVVVYHTVRAQWLHLLVPAIGVMFALGGTLMAVSLDRSGLTTVPRRLRRLLPPVWLYGAVTIVLGWDDESMHRSWWSTLIFWLIPLRDPHIHAAGLVDTMWYLRTYLWFVLLSPVLLAVFRRVGLVMVMAPLAGLVGLALCDVLVLHHGLSDGLPLDLLTYAPCWLLGFAASDGLLYQIPARVCALLSGIAGLASVALLVGQLAGIVVGTTGAVAYAFWSAAVVLSLLRWQPGRIWLRGRPLLARFSTAVSARALSIYLWHDPMIVATASLAALVGLHLVGILQVPVVLLFTAVVVLAVGWVEDVAARRPPRLIPTGTEDGARPVHRVAPQRNGHRGFADRRRRRLPGVAATQSGHSRAGRSADGQRGSTGSEFGHPSSMPDDPPTAGPEEAASVR